jgi:RNA polymerase sigma-70 factor (ECF subfamily)
MSPVAPSESQLLARSKRGDLAAFSELVRLHQNSIRAYLRVRLTSKDEADDLAQDVFVTAFDRINTLQDQPFGAWLRRIALNHLRNFRRKFRAAPAGDNQDLQELLEGEIPRHVPEGQESATIDALRECMDGLDGPSSSLLEERYVMGRTVREIAAQTNRGYSALTMQLHRLRVLLSDCIRTKTQTPAAQ